MREAAIALCQSDGRFMASDERFARLFGGAVARAVDEAARQLNCPALAERFAAFTAAQETEAQCLLAVGAQEYELTLRRLAGDEQHLVLLALSARDETQRLSEIGRMTARLIHDFKNQMGGLKLYTAYLKKRFADVPEGAEIAEKISAGLNVMAEHAALVGRLTRPLELRCEAGDLAQLAASISHDLRVRAAASGVQFENSLEEDAPEVSFDPQQLRAALQTIVARAVEVSSPGGAVQVRLRNSGGRLHWEVEDSGALLNETQRETLFALLPGERLTKAALDLALARRIIVEHGGQITVTAAGRNLISVSFPAI